MFNAKTLIAGLVVLIAIVGITSLTSTYTPSTVTEVPPSTQVAQVSVPTSGLIGYWTFDGGSTTDSSGNGNSASFKNGATTVAGKFGDAVSLDGVDDYVSLGRLSGTEGASQLTWTAWVKADFSGNNGCIICKGDPNNGTKESWEIRNVYTGYNNTTNDLISFIASAPDSNDNVAPMSVTVGQPLADNTWTHVAVVFDGTASSNANKLKMYVNGSLVNANIVGTIPAATLVSSLDARIGQASDGSRKWGGAVDDVRIYNKALTSSDVSAIYAYDGGSSGSTTPTTPSTYKVTLYMAGDGNGYVSSNPQFSSCDSATKSCYMTVEASTVVTMNTVSLAGNNSTFTGWSGACSGTGTCTFTVNADTSVTATFKALDVTAPTISNVVSSNVTSSAATISWTTNEASDSQVEYGLTTAYGSQSALNMTMLTSHTQTLSGLSQNTTYNFRVKSKDASGNIAVSTNATFKTASAYKFTIGDKVSITSDKVAVRATPTTKGKIVFWAYTGETGSVIGGPTVANGYTWWQVNYPSRGVSGWTVETYLQKTGGTTVNQPPTVSLSASPTSGTVPFTSTLDANASDADGYVTKVEFYNGSTLLNTDTVAPYSYVWGINNASTYTLTAKAYDNAGAVTTSNAVTVTASAVLADTTAPSTPTNLATTNITQTSLTLSWTASTDASGISKYNVYNGTTLIGSPTGTTFNVTGLNAATSYTFKVEAVDGSTNQNKSAQASITATTLSTVDTTKPTVPTNLTATAVSSSQINVSWTASTDNVGVIGYKIYRSGTYYATVTGGTTFQNTGLSADSTYYYSVSAYDQAGNESAQTAQVSAKTQAGTALTPLPSGNAGIASQYPGDVNIKSNASVLFADDFESYSSASQLTNSYSSYYQSGNTRIATESANIFSGSKSLEFTQPQTTSEVANAVVKNLGTGVDTLFVRVYTKFDSGFDVVTPGHNGIRISAGSYPGPGNIPNGTDFFLFSLENSTYYNESEPGYTHVYSYHPEQRSEWGDHWYPDGKILPYDQTPNNFGSQFVARSNFIPQKDKWYSYELMVKANTPGQRDGRVAIWVDGTIVADFPNLRLRDTTSLKINQVQLEQHSPNSSTRANKKWYDNLVVATSYIGPMYGTVTPPASTKFNLNDRVVVADTTVNVRDPAAGASMGTQALNALGTVIGGPTYALLNNIAYWWWNINFDSGTDGWVAEDFISKYVAPSAPTAILSASPTSITAGQSSTLSWSSTNASSCTASGGWTGTKSTAGTQTVTPSQTTTYSLSCTGTGGTSSTQNVTVTVTTTPPPTGGTVTLSSGDQSTVQSAINNASAGTTIVLPAGSWSWSGLTISKAITLKGSGTRGTNINLSGGNTIYKQTDGVIRISNFTFTKSGGGTAAKGFYIYGPWKNAEPIIFENNTFTINGSGLFDIGVAGGVIIAKNDFTGAWDDSFLQLKDVQDVGGSWSTADTMGSKDTTGKLNIYVENNTFYGGTNQGIDADDGARIVYRYNTLTYSDFNSHGLDTSKVGLRHFEVYNNTFSYPGANSNQITNQNQMVWIRGGTGVIFNNKFDELSSPSYWGSKPEIRMNIRGAEDVRPQGACTDVKYPVPRQLGQNHNGTSYTTDPIYIWGNTGTSNLDIAAGWGWGNPCGFTFSTFFQWGRDGVNGTAKPGYTPYQYPHPLRSI